MDMKKEILTSIKVFIGFSILLGLIYPLGITWVSQLTMPNKANGSLIKKDGKVIGSKLIGQKFDKPGYFHSRPSAVDYNATGSGGSNLGPTSQKLITRASEEIKTVQNMNNLKNTTKVPADAVLTSASGLDPHISPKNADLQIPRIAKTRKLPDKIIRELVRKNTNPNFIGIWGQDGVNVLKLNIELDKISSK